MVRVTVAMASAFKRIPVARAYAKWSASVKKDGQSTSLPAHVHALTKATNAA